jgi:DNA-binding NtrC family response regulator
MAKILIVDDELSIVEILKTLLKKGGHSVTCSIDGNDALKLLKENVFDLMITDVRLPGLDGISLLPKAKELQSHLAVIVMTAYADVENAVLAMKNGAFDYVTKPFKFDELMLTIERALSYETALAENKVLKTTLHTKFHFNFIVGDSDSMLEIYRLIEKIARTNSTVLVLGDSGTGKELIAKALHDSSSRSENAFIKVNCAAMPETLLESELFGYVKGAFTGANANKKGLFEMADNGTIFLDEIGSIPLSMQMKLLRVLQEKEIRRVGGTEDIAVDVRVIAATNENLEEKIARNEFREDLYFRLSVIPINVPSLRERKDDIPMLVTHFLSQFEEENKIKMSISSDAVKILCSYEWPGNIRQLENLIKRLATLNDSGQIDKDELPPEIRNYTGFSNSAPLIDSSGMGAFVSGRADQDNTLPLKEHMRRLEERYIKQVVAQNHGDKEKAAKELGISLATLYRKAGAE